MTVNTPKTKAWLVKAKTGGYEKSSDQLDHADLLNPLFWQALGKVEGWLPGPGFTTEHHASWDCKMHDMVDALAEGKTIEAYFETL